MNYFGLHSATNRLCTPSGGVFHTINRVIHRCLWMTGLVGARRGA